MQVNMSVYSNCYNLAKSIKLNGNSLGEVGTFGDDMLELRKWQHAIIVQIRLIIDVLNQLLKTKNAWDFSSAAYRAHTTIKQISFWSIAANGSLRRRKHTTRIQKVTNMTGPRKPIKQISFWSIAANGSLKRRKHTARIQTVTNMTGPRKRFNER